MDSDQGKLFIGGISWETTEEKLREHFGQYGEVSHAVIMRDKITGRPRGFGFVVFADPDLLDRVLQDKHTIDGRTVEAKRAMSREEQQTTGRSGNNNAGRAVSGDTGASVRTKKIFVGGLPPTLTEDAFRQYFQQYGNVTDVVVMYDQNTHRPRGFGFISFDSEDAVDRVLHKTFHELYGKQVEVKHALPKDANPNRSSGGNYQSYGGSDNTNSYDSITDNRYMQQQSTGGAGYPYGSSGYGAPNYGYGTGGNGYGGYGVGGYGGGVAGGYGNPNPPPTGYMGGHSGGYGASGVPRGPWNNQAPSGYGSAGYGGNIGYGMASSWNTSSGGGSTGTAHTGQSPSGVPGYGNQGYGYGGYVGGEGTYGSQGGYGGARGSGEPTSTPSRGAGEQGSGYIGSGYVDVNGSSGYTNAWKPDPSQGGPYGAAQGHGSSGGPATYGGSYGGPGRQLQQQ